MTLSSVSSGVWTDIRNNLEDIYVRKGFKFRGQSDASWLLEPALARECKSLEEAQIRNVEIAFAHDFARAGHLKLPVSAVPLSPDTDNKAILGWWVYMQHYGAPTRLLDWTSSPYVAAYFAAFENWGVDGAVWYFDQNALNKDLSKDFDSIDWRCPTPHPAVYAFYPQRPTDRILAQKGTFTVCATGSMTHNFGLEPYSLGKVTIPVSAKAEILKSLLSMNVSANVLFPGLDGMGRELKLRLKVMLTE